MRHAGQVDAGPLPGQRDISKPQVALPPAVRRLLDGLTPKQKRKLGGLPAVPGLTGGGAGGAGGSGASDPGSGQDLLDFLLGS